MVSEIMTFGVPSDLMSGDLPFTYAWYGFYVKTEGETDNFTAVFEWNNGISWQRE